MGIQGLREQILANSKQVMIHMSANNARRAKNHELVVREEGKKYKAVILCENKIRIEGAEATTPKEALEVLLNVTAQMLEVASETWEEGYAGEDVVERGDGSRVAKEREPDSDVGGDAEKVDNVGEAAGIEKKRKRGRPRKIKTVGVAAGEDVDAVEAPPKRRGRPPKST